MNTLSLVLQHKYEMPSRLKPTSRTDHEQKIKRRRRKRRKSNNSSFKDFRTMRHVASVVFLLICIRLFLCAVASNVNVQQFIIHFHTHMEKRSTSTQTLNLCLPLSLPYISIVNPHKYIVSTVHIIKATGVVCSTSQRGNRPSIMREKEITLHNRIYLGC